MEDIKELIAALSTCSRAKGHRCSECPLLSRYDYRVCAKTVMQKAATALASFLSENERLRFNCYPRDGVEAIIRERDAYKEELSESQRREQAAVEDMERMANSSPIGRCIFCKHEHDEDCKHGGRCFKWRGNILRR